MTTKLYIFILVSVFMTLNSVIHCCTRYQNLIHPVHELGRAPRLGQNHPRGLSVDRVEGFRQVYEDGNEVYILFHALLHLAYREDHVGGAAV